MSSDLIKQPLRCLITNNPVGTDTMMIGGGCECQVCQTASHIEELKAALRKCHTALEVAFDYDGDDVFGMMHNDAVDASMEAERLLGIK